jgi:hypothetical protein
MLPSRAPDLCRLLEPHSSLPVWLGAVFVAALAIDVLGPSVSMCHEHSFSRVRLHNDVVLAQAQHWATAFRRCIRTLLSSIRRF